MRSSSKALFCYIDSHDSQGRKSSINKGLAKQAKPEQLIYLIETWYFFILLAMQNVQNQIKERNERKMVTLKLAKTSADSS